MDDRSLTRQKKSDTDNVLPPVSELLQGLLKDEQEIKFTYTNLDGVPVTLNPTEVAKCDPFPLPMPIDREGYCPEELSHRFWEMGYADWQNVLDANSRFLQSDSSRERIRLLDFGCASGRVLRHALTFSEDEVEPWGCDFAPTNIHWLKRHLPDGIRSFINTAVPHLPFEDNYFDVVTAFSVLTHIGQLEEAWLLELRRITRPTGLLYLTVQNDDSWSRVLQRPSAFNRLKKANEFDNAVKVDEQLFSNPMPKRRIVLTMPGVKNYSYNVWHRNDYLRESWGQYFDVLHIGANAHANYQSAAILRPKN